MFASSGEFSVLSIGIVSELLHFAYIFLILWSLSLSAQPPSECLRLWIPGGGTDDVCSALSLSALPSVQLLCFSLKLEVPLSWLMPLR